MSTTRVCWEHFTWNLGRHDNFDQLLCERGEDGWELVSVVHSPWDNELIAFFKRPKEADDAG